MEGKNRGAVPDLKEKLIAEGHRFSFIQAYRLILHLIGKEKGCAPDVNLLSNHIRVRPELSLSFPGTDVVKIEEIPGDDIAYRITASFLGLYGSSSPLPTFYTEDLLQERLQDHSISRDFIDIFNNSLYSLFFECWSVFNLFHRIYEEEDKNTMLKLFCLIGLEGSKLRQSVPDAMQLLSYTGILSQFPRSAEGLCSIISGIINVRNIEVIQCEKRIVDIPEEQRISLGVANSVLGEDAYIGNWIIDRAGRFVVKIGPVDVETYERLLPGNEYFPKINRVIEFYLDQPLLWDIEIVIKEDEIIPSRLGGESWSQLGFNTWIESDASYTSNSVMFQPEIKIIQ